jgi:hypothetical protein
VSGKREVDDAETLVPPVSLPVLGIVVDEGNQLEICPVPEKYQPVLRLAVRMATSWRYAEVSVKPFRCLNKVSVRDEDNDVIFCKGISQMAVSDRRLWLYPSTLTELRIVS